jgi:competence ComEA-like helix-hairpin-helix protein
LPALTPEERRGGLLVVLLLLIGAGWDAWRAFHVPRPPHVVGHPATAVHDATPPAPPDSARAAPGPEPALDLNRAELRDLDALPGIGPVLAARIVEHRRRHGPFHSVEELRAVRGVGPRLLEKLRPLVRAGS